MKPEYSAVEPPAAPCAWTIPGDDTADMNGFIPARINSEGEFTKPLYARASIPPTGAHPAAIQCVAVKNGQAVVIGVPAQYPHLPDDHPWHHNCDAMGCSSVEHMLWRGPVQDESTAVPPSALPPPLGVAVRIVDGEKYVSLGDYDRLRNALKTVGDDYPGSSCQKWCYEQAGLSLTKEGGQ